MSGLISKLSQYGLLALAARSRPEWWDLLRPQFPEVSGPHPDPWRSSWERVGLNPRYLSGDPVGRGYGRRARHDLLPLSHA